MKIRIDLNADLGEGQPHDQELMPFLSSCSIACGGHFGDENTVKKTLQLATQWQVKAGAHPSYPDRVHFGRTSMSLSLHELLESLKHQLDLFHDLCAEVHHIKLHGALYNDVFSDIEKAEALVNLFLRYHPHQKIYCAPRSALSKVVESSSLVPVYEGFSDRRYTTSGTLVARSKQGALIENEVEMAAQVLQLVTQQRVTSIMGKIIPLQVQTLCFHSEGKNALRNLSHVSKRLKEEGVVVHAV